MTGPRYWGDDADASWMVDAACKDKSPDLFFPPAGKDQDEPAKRICFRCPVREECLEYAMSTNMTHGVWGGLSAKQRSRLKRHRKEILDQRVPHGTVERFSQGCRCSACSGEARRAAPGSSKTRRAHS